MMSRERQHSIAQSIYLKGKIYKQKIYKQKIKQSYGNSNRSIYDHRLQ